MFDLGPRPRQDSLYLRKTNTETRQGISWLCLVLVSDWFFLSWFRNDGNFLSCLGLSWFLAVVQNLGFSMFIEIILISMVSIWFRLFRIWFYTNFRCSHNDLLEFSLVYPSQCFFNDVNNINFEIFNVFKNSFYLHGSYMVQTRKMHENFLL